MNTSRFLLKEAVLLFLQGVIGVLAGLLTTIESMMPRAETGVSPRITIGKHSELIYTLVDPNSSTADFS